jgi:hypothetical protein
VSPNPFSSYVNISIDWSKTENTTVKVFSMSGREIVAKNVQMTKGTNYVAISELNALPVGSYIIKFNTAEGSIYKQVIKQ